MKRVMNVKLIGYLESDNDAGGFLEFMSEKGTRFFTYLRLCFYKLIIKGKGIKGDPYRLNKKLFIKKGKNYFKLEEPIEVKIVLIANRTRNSIEIVKPKKEFKNLSTEKSKEVSYNLDEVSFIGKVKKKISEEVYLVDVGDLIITLGIIVAPEGSSAAIVFNKGPKIKEGDYIKVKHCELYSELIS